MQFILIPITIFVLVTKSPTVDGNLQLPLVATADKLLQNTPINKLGLSKVSLPVIPAGSASDDSASDKQQAAPQHLTSIGKKSKKPVKITKIQATLQQIPTPPAPKPEQKYNFGPVISGVGEDDTTLKASLCHKEDDSCLDNLVKAEPETPKSLKDKLKHKLLLERKYDAAMKEGAAQAAKENIATGGAPAFGGLQLPDWDPDSKSALIHKNKTNSLKAGHSDKKGNQPGKTHKVTTTTTTLTSTTSQAVSREETSYQVTSNANLKDDEPDVATAPDS